MRIGLGYDSHRLVSGRPLILGGVNIPFDKGLKGHSDADALLHAVIDACLGALNLGDIGQLYPDTNPKYKDISSMVLLKETAELIKDKGYSISNLDAVIIAEQPKLSEYYADMADSIAGAFGCSVSCISIKSKTNEGMGETGQGEAIAVYAVCMLKPVS